MASFLLGALTIKVLKSKRLNLVSGNKSKGFFYLAMSSSAVGSSFSSFFVSFFFNFFFLFLLYFFFLLFGLFFSDNLLHLRCFQRFNTESEMSPDLLPLTETGNTVEPSGEIGKRCSELLVEEESHGVPEGRGYGHISNR